MRVYLLRRVLSLPKKYTLFSSSKSKSTQKKLRYRENKVAESVFIAGFLELAGDRGNADLEGVKTRTCWEETANPIHPQPRGRLGRHNPSRGRKSTTVCPRDWARGGEKSCRAPSDCPRLVCKCRSCAAGLCRCSTRRRYGSPRLKPDPSTQQGIRQSGLALANYVAMRTGPAISGALA